MRHINNSNTQIAPVKIAPVFRRTPEIIQILRDSVPRFIDYVDLHVPSSEIYYISYSQAECWFRREPKKRQFTNALTVENMIKEKNFTLSPPTTFHKPYDLMFQTNAYHN